MNMLATIALSLLALSAPPPPASSLIPPGAPTHAAPVAALDDATIIAIFDAANTWDIETSQLAVRKSRNKDIRTFAETMIHDHSAVRKLGRDLAAKLKVTPTPPGKDFALAIDHADAMRTLEQASGAAFDKAYIDHEVSYHQAVIDAVTQQLLPATKNAELRDLENKVAPNFVAHLAMGKKIQQAVNK